jgi:hypothetical membrane protein
MVDAGRSSATARTAGAGLLIVAAVQYVACEAVTASAWKNPAYSYTHNNISDLGVPSCGGKVGGRVICSPDHTLMNASFILQGVLFLVAALLLFRLLPSSRRRVYPILAAVHAVGFTLVGLFHGSPEAGADGGMIVHIFGAALLIFSGNIALIVVGRQLLGALRQRWPGMLGIVLGTLGLLSLVVMGAAGGKSWASTFERGSVYTFILGEFVAGVLLLVIRRSRVATDPEPASVDVN